MAGSPGAGHVDPGLAALLAVAFCGSAVFTLASPIKGRSHFGSHAPAYAGGGGEPLRSRQGGADDHPASVLAVEETVAMPWLVDVSHAVCVGMAFMLVLTT